MPEAVIPPAGLEKPMPWLKDDVGLDPKAAAVRAATAAVDDQGRDFAAIPPGSPGADTGAALDALLAKKQEGTIPPPEDDSVKVKLRVEDPPGSAKPAAGDTEAEAKAKADAEAKAKADAEAQAKAEADARAKEFLPDVQLPAKASPKSAEAFAQVKAHARERIDGLTKELEEAKAKLAEAEKKLADPIPEDLKKEVAELRGFRDRLDVEASPRIVEFDQKLQKTADFIYAQLARAGISAEVVAEIKKFGGPHKVAMEPIVESIKDASLANTLRVKLAELDQHVFDKGAAIEEAKKNASEYVANLAKESVEGTAREFDSLVGRTDWLKPKAGPENDALNKTIAESLAEARVAARDGSPNMRATLLLGMVKLAAVETLRERDQLTIETLTKGKEAAEKAKADADKRIEELEKELAAIRASSGRVRTNAPPAGAARPPAATPGVVNTDTGGALDKIAAEIAAKNAAAGR